LESIDGKPDALRRYMPRLVAELKRQLGRDILSLKYQRKEVTDFYEKFGAWFVPIDDLRRWTDKLSETVAKEAIPGFDLGLDDPPPPKPAATPTPNRAGGAANP